MDDYHDLDGKIKYEEVDRKSIEYQKVKKIKREREELLYKRIDELETKYKELLIRLDAAEKIIRERLPPPKSTKERIITKC